MRADLVWTHLSVEEIRRRLKSKKSLSLAWHTIKRLLVKCDFKQRKLAKVEMLKRPQNREEQFVNIENYKRYYLGRKLPVLSIDTKKKEWLGRFYRPGQVWAQGRATCFDHDYASFATGRMVPHGIYDIGRNEAYMSLGQSADTAEFSVDCLRWWWREFGKNIYKGQNSILLLCDGGGSNGSRNRLFKWELQNWADEEGLKIRVCHYPAYCSKYNPIEHRLFPHITRAWTGVLLDSIQTASKLIDQRVNQTMDNLRVKVRQIPGEFKKGIKVEDSFFDTADIYPNKVLGQWNYRIFGYT